MNQEQKAINEYIKYADDFFDQVKGCFGPPAQAERLAFTFKLPEEINAELHIAVDSYIIRALEINGIQCGEDDPYQVLYRELNKVKNVTANGSVLAKKELTAELNKVHKTIVSMLDLYNAEKVFSYGQAFPNIRISTKERLKPLFLHPFGSVKLHTDPWAGEPMDQFIFMTPIYLDADHMNLEVVENTPATDPNTLSVAENYDNAIKTIELTKAYDVELTNGYACVLDPRAVHRTLLDPLPTIRCSCDFRFRIKIPEKLKKLDRLIGETQAAKNLTYIPYSLWTQVGRTKSYDIVETHDEFVDRINSPNKETLNHRYNTLFRPKFVDMD